VGHVATQTFTTCPHGISVAIFGKRITKEICDYLVDIFYKDIRVNG
jgi:arginine/lysine/ornithine decarboxylase